MDNDLFSRTVRAAWPMLLVSTLAIGTTSIVGVVLAQEIAGPRGKEAPASAQPGGQAAEKSKDGAAGQSPS